MSIGPGEFTRVRRLPKYAVYDEDQVLAIFDAARYCHLAGVVNSRAMVLPTLHAREGRTLYLHGSRSNALFRAVLEEGRATVTATVLDGLRLARTGFESSLAYRSVVALGTVREIEEDEEKSRVLDRLVDHVLPGRTSEVRPANPRELALTTVLAVDILEASGKIAHGPTEDEPEDAAQPVWAGFVPLVESYGTPVTQRDGALAEADLPLPPSLRRWMLDREALADEIRALEPVDEREETSKEAVLTRLEMPEPTSEEASPHHLTASAFVVSSRGVVLHRHRRLGIWVQPGGHIDPGEDPPTAALRETTEETGLPARHLDPPLLLHVDRHPGPRGHTHYDLRYLLVSDPVDPSPPPEESQEIGWFDEAAAFERATPDLQGALHKVFDYLRSHPESVQ